MKTFPLLCFFLSISFFINAQNATLDANLIPKIGDKWTAEFLLDTNINPGDSGDNQSWDFSTIDRTNSFTLNFEILPVDNGPDAQRFPDATFIWYMDGFDFYNYYIVDSDSMALLGNVVYSNGEIDFTTVYTDPQDIYRFPMSLGDRHDYEAFYENFLGGSMLDAQARNGSAIVDAKGQLKTPFGTYDNVLRVKITDEVFGITTTQYAWMQPGNFIPLLVYEFSSDIEETPSVYYSRPESTTSIEHADISPEWQPSVSPNPLKDVFRLQWPSGNKVTNRSFKISDPSGRQIHQAILPHTNDTYEWRIPSQLPNGMYLLECRSAGKVKTLKLVLQR